MEGNRSNHLLERRCSIRKTKLKICGLFRPEDIEAANLVQPDFAGFVLAPGFRRSITGEQAAEFRRKLDGRIQAVGVFVDAPEEEIASYLKEDIIQMAQLHGEETEEEIRFLKAATGRPVMKAVKVQGREDVERWLDSAADYLLFDSGTGSGRIFDWNLLADVERDYFLAGGLNAVNLPEALTRLRPRAVDLSSGVETDGVKDLKKMLAVAKLVRGTVY